MWYISVTSISVYFPATALRKDNLQFTENLFTYHGEAFHSSFYFLHYRAASLCMGHSVTTRNSLPTLRIQWENSKATIDPSNIYSVSCIRFCFCFLFMGEIRSPNLRAMQINHERAAPQRRSATPLFKHLRFNFWNGLHFYWLYHFIITYQKIVEEYMYRKYHEHEDSWCQLRNLSPLLPAASRGGVKEGTAYVPTLPPRSSEPQRDIG